MTKNVDVLLESASLKIRAQSPFFGTLLLCAKTISTVNIDTAATDGSSIFYNPEFVVTLQRGELEAVLLHEVLHCALLHIMRRGSRDPKRWNIAADIVVNGIIGQQHVFTLPEGALHDANIDMLPTEEVYELVPIHAQLPGALHDLAPPGVSEEKRSWQGDGAMGESAKARLTSRWRTAIQHAQTIARGVKTGWVPLGYDREFNELNTSQINWRAQLWRFLVTTPSDFSGFDRRFISRGLYLDDLTGESIEVDVVIDTSGSIDEDVLGQFMAEINTITRAHPHICCQLFYADSELHGPYAVTKQSTIPPPKGGGGTSFVPYFEYRERHRAGVPKLSVYLTDGYGEFPERPPRHNVLWVVCPGGLASDDFPFGKVINARSA